jgi:hypothetical protein
MHLDGLRPGAVTGPLPAEPMSARRHQMAMRGAPGRRRDAAA